MNSKILKGKKGIILGVLNENSIAWEVAKKCKEEGAKIILSNAPLAVRFGEVQSLARQLNVPVIGADVTKMEDLESLIDKSMKLFKGQFDFILHSVAMSNNIRKNHGYTELNHEYMLKTIDISAISFHKLLQVCYQKNAIADWGSAVALTYIASKRIFPQYSEMADAKSLLEGISRSFGLHYAAKNNVRINTISQSPVKTTAGGAIDGFDDFWNYSDQMSPLGNAPAKNLAAFCVTMFSDYTRYITMQNIYHDGGFSATGLTEKVISSFKE